MMKASTLAALIAAFSLSGGLLSSLSVMAAPQLLSGQLSEERVAQLTTQIPWYRSLPDAERSANQQGKLIFWVHMLGSISGGT